MPRALVINDTIREIIAKAIEAARANPLDSDHLQKHDNQSTVIALSDRKPGYERGIASQQVFIPSGYRAAFSTEMQPVGLCYHLSISVDTPGRLPHMQAVIAIAQEFGMKDIDKSWLEEFEPHHYAVNLLYVAEVK